MKMNDSWKILKIQFFLVWIVVLWEIIWLAKSEQKECWGLHLNTPIADVFREEFCHNCKVCT